MKLTRKLIPAFALLLVSAVLMSTASFAWFSMNKDVKADGIMVTATAPAALWIARVGNEGPGAYQTTIEFEREDNLNATDGDESHDIAPVTMIYAANDNKAYMIPGTENTASTADAWKFYGLSNTEMSKVDQDGVHPGLIFGDNPETTDVVEVANVQSDSANFFKAAFYLKLEGTKNVDKKTVSAEITLSNATVNGNDQIFKSLRMAIVTAGIQGGSQGGYAVYEWNQSLGKSALKNFMTIHAQEDVVVYFYVWFEGQDTDCKNSNAQNYNDFKLDIAFQTGDAT